MHVCIDYTALITRIQQWKFCRPSGTLQTDQDLLQVSTKLATDLNLELITHHVREVPPG